MVEESNSPQPSLNLREGENRLVLIDGHAMLYRAWFAFPQTLTRRDGTIINAVYGFTRILLNVIEEMQPKYLAVSFDVGRTFRHDMYEPYKAHREKMPDELKAQEPVMNELLKALNVPVQTKKGFEADDVIGTLAFQARDREVRSTKHEARDNITTIIVTGDKDILQLVRDPSARRGRVQVYMPGRGAKPPVTYTEELVEEDLGLGPRLIPDLKGLMGDSSDNIPGVKGVGPKTAVPLLKEFGSVEGLYMALAESGIEIPDRLTQQIRQAVEDDNLGLDSLPSLSNKEVRKRVKLTPSVEKKLVQDAESAFESKELATIVTDVPLKLDLEACKVREYDKERALKMFDELGFMSLVRQLPNDAFEESVQEALF